MDKPPDPKPASRTLELVPIPNFVIKNKIILEPLIESVITRDSNESVKY